tara:strand:+ start:292 stop:1143 length:852 start_codon:yes stop_codon:yes gene_type:complete
MHIPWKNCPTAWAGQYTSGKEDGPSVVLEAVADERTWIWHSFFGKLCRSMISTHTVLLLYKIMCNIITYWSLSINSLHVIVGSPGSNNDININDRSPLWVHVAEGSFPSVAYQMVQGTESQLYFAADNIYPQFPIFMQSCGDSSNPVIHFFSKRLEAVRKDVERAFGILQARFAFLKKPVLLWSLERMETTVLCCIILHNMIIEEEMEYPGDSDANLLSSSYIQWGGSSAVESEGSTLQKVPRQYSLDTFVANTRSAQSLNKFISMRNNLINHMYHYRHSIKQ